LFVSNFNTSKIEALQVLKKLYTAWKLAIILRWWIHHPSHYSYDSERYKREAFAIVKSRTRIEDFIPKIEKTLTVD